MDLHWLSIRELQEALRTKKISARELLAALQARFEAHDRRVGAVLEIFETESILSAASAAGPRAMGPLPVGPLHGIPGLIKDNICMQGRRMTCASKILETYRAPYSATVIEKLHKAGALCMGRANMDEFAMGSATITSAYQQTYNPWDLRRVPGGSSGGSIAAVAAGFVPWALGSETGGSVRQPAAWCGVVGSKPTYGLVSRYGLTAYGSSVDQIGVATRTVYDNALVLSTIAGREAEVRDATARELPADYDITRQLDGELPRGLRIGIVENALHHPGMSASMVEILKKAVSVLEGLGAHIEPVTVSSMDLSAATYFVLSRAEAASNLARFDGVRYGARSKKATNLEEVYTYSRSEGFGNEVQSRILIGNYVLSRGHADAFYRTALAARQVMREECATLFKKVDLIFAPVSPIEAFVLGELSADSLELDLQDYFTCFANLAGIPAISVPCGFTEKHQMPVGFQLMGPAWSEERLFKAAYAYEQVTPWHTMHPADFV